MWNMLSGADVSCIDTGWSINDTTDLRGAVASRQSLTINIIVVLHLW